MHINKQTIPKNIFINGCLHTVLCPNFLRIATSMSCYVCVNITCSCFLGYDHIKGQMVWFGIGQIAERIVFIYLII